MKKIIVVAGLVTLAACSKPEATEEAAPAEAATEAPAVTTTAADGGPSTGTWEVTMADGTKITSQVKEDGTYEVKDAEGKVVETGKWEQKSPEQYCETPDKEGAVQKCYEEHVDANGVYTSKDPETGNVSTVVRVTT